MPKPFQRLADKQIIQVDEYSFEQSQSQENNPEDDFMFTFGQNKKQLINKLFDTPPIAIHTKISLNTNNYSKQSQNTKQFTINFNKTRRIKSSANISQQKKFQQLQKIKQNLSKCTYSIKTIDSKNDQDIGISTKRSLMSFKTLQKQKQKNKQQQYWSNRKCKYQSINHFQDNCKSYYQNQSICDNFNFILERQNYIKTKNVIPHNKFISKPLQVVKKKKQNPLQYVTSQLETQIKKEFQLQNRNQDQNKKQQYFSQNLLKNNVIKLRNLHQTKNKVTVQNKRLKYQQFLLKSQISRKKENCFLKSQTNKINIELTNPLNTKQTCILRQHNFNSLNSSKPLQLKRKVSLSNFLSQYQTQIIQRTIQHNDIIQINKINQSPLKQIFRRKFSTIDTNSIKNEQPLCNKKFTSKMNKQTIRNQRNCKTERQRGECRKSIKKFKRYHQIEKQNLY